MQQGIAEQWQVLSRELEHHRRRHGPEAPPSAHADVVKPAPRQHEDDREWNSIQPPDACQEGKRGVGSEHDRDGDPVASATHTVSQGRSRRQAGSPIRSDSRGPSPSGARVFEQDQDFRRRKHPLGGRESGEQPARRRALRCNPDNPVGSVRTRPADKTEGVQLVPGEPADEPQVANEHARRGNLQAVRRHDRDEREHLQRAEEAKAED